MKIDCIVGIDPGANGGIVKWRPNENITAIQMPKDINELKDYLLYLKSICSPIVFLEKLSVRPDDVTPGADGVNMGKLYRIQKMMANFEQLKAIIAVCDIPFVMVHPMKWQNELKLRAKTTRKKEEKNERKRRYKEVAREFIPGIETDIVERRRHVDNALWTIHFAQQPRLGASEFTKQHARTFILAP